MRIKRILQHDERDCGAVCIAIILEYYGRKEPPELHTLGCGMWRSSN